MAAAAWRRRGGSGSTVAALSATVAVAWPRQLGGGATAAAAWRLRDGGGSAAEAARGRRQSGGGTAKTYKMIEIILTYEFICPFHPKMIEIILTYEFICPFSP